jgi:hypothetical protein
MPFAINNEQSGISVPVCPAQRQPTEPKGFFGATFRRAFPLLQARAMSERLIILIPIIGPASA